MKKLLLSSLLMGTVFSFAQTQRTQLVNTKNEPVTSHKKVNYAGLKKTNPLVNKTASTTGSTWVNYVDFIELVSPSTQVFSAMSLFPDSAIILGYDASSQPVYPWIHKAANYLDPSFNVQQTILDDKTTPYVVDSVSVGYIYERVGTSTVADTLIFQVIAEDHSLDWDLTDISYQDITYSAASNDLSGMTVLKKIKYPLNIADTCSGSLYKQIMVATNGITIPAGQKVGCVISFKPGYSYTTTDVLIGDATNAATKNVFFMYSSEQNGASTDPTYYGTLGDYTSDMNMSYILDQSVRYGTNANGWNGYFLPTYAYTTPFAYETHDIGYKISVSITAVNDLKEKGFALGQNFPNPFNSSSSVNYQLAKDAKSVSFTVTDVMGRLISSENVASTTGIHTINLGSYASGVYYYSLNVDGNVTTKKMIVE